MKKIITSILAAFALAGVTMAQTTIKDANVETREAKNFTVIKLSSSFDVYLTQGNEESVAVSASEQKFLADIKVEVKNGVLEVRYDPKGGRWNSGNKKLKAYISFKQLDKLEASGACDVDIVGVWKTDGAKIYLSGASDLTGKLNFQKLNVNISGASDLKLSGNVGSLDIEASGASSFKGYELSADYCNAKASGASDIKIMVNKELSANASGASDINYKGAGTVRELKANGASSVHKRS
jgi:hypothetical protein